jgi:hypothetical protein
MNSILPDVLAWVAVLVIGAGWYLARKGRRIREAKEARAAVALSDATAIVRKFGVLMEATSGAPGAGSLAVFDVALLPFPKETIKGALLLCYAATPDKSQRAALGGAMVWLCQFQPNVGPAPLTTFGGALDLADPADKSAMLDAAHRIAAWGDSPDHGRWRELNAIVDAEMAGVVATLKELDRTAPAGSATNGKIGRAARSNVAVTARRAPMTFVRGDKR